MAVMNKFQPFSEAIAEKIHNLQSDVLKIALTNTAPSAANSQLSNITQIAAGNGYVAGGNVASQVSSAQTAGVYKLVLNNTVFTASGGSIGPFRYAVLYNDTATNKNLIGWADYGSSITIADTETFTVTFDAINGALTLA